MPSAVKRLSEILSSDAVLSNGLNSNLEVAGLAWDSRSVTKGSLFFAIPGTRTNAIQYEKDAIRAGAVAVVCEENNLFKEAEKRVFVKSVRHEMALASSRWFGEPTREFKLIGVTGTNGKSTSCYLLRQIWQSMNLASGIVGTVQTCLGDICFDSHLTTPDPFTLQSYFSQMKQNGVRMAAIEVSSIALDQFRTDGSKFEVALFTNLTRDHLDYHGNMETYARAKRRLFGELSPEYLVVNIDDPWADTVVPPSGNQRITYSLKNPSSDFFAKSFEIRPTGIRACIATPRGERILSSPLSGQYNLMNLLSVIAANFAAGISVDDSIVGLRTASGAPGRLERVMHESRFPNIYVDYAHSDDALRNVLNAVIGLRGENSAAKIITVFGCGGDRDRTKRAPMANIVSSLSDVTIATSDNPRTEVPDRIVDDIESGVDLSKTEYHREVDRRKAIELALAIAAPHDFVLIAGKGHETYQILGSEKIPFDDREVVRDYYRRVL